MTQATPSIGANKSGLQYRTEDNDGKKALLNHHKGATAPAYAEAGSSGWTIPRRRGRSRSMTARTGSNWVTSTRRRTPSILI